LAEQFVAYPAIYFPHSLDFRGRMYPISQWVHPQGPDYAKALLTFAESKPIGDEQGPGWLAIHGANCFGVDKIGLEERIDWVEQNIERICAVASDPLQCLWWTEADSPWSFLAFCFEWQSYTAALKRGAGEYFMSCLPVMVDGSCNGIQHFSAMLRDKVGGTATNLVPSDKPSDIYGLVAARVTTLLLHESGHGTDEAARAIAALWYAIGIDRKVTKRPVMVLPYGGTYSSCRDYVEQAVRERGKLPFADAETEDKAIRYLASMVWASIGDVVIGARTGMAWLQSMARLVLKHGGKQVWWRTPSGLKVTQRYVQTKDLQIKTTFLGKVKKMRAVVDTDEVSASQQINGFSPNFVHSLDAVCLVDTLNLGEQNGIGSFAAVHDSYGTHAADMQMLAACIRRAFVNLYTDNDVLSQLRDNILLQVPEGVEVPMPPPMGELDIQDVLNSDFFFA
jgi:DNA-directed RNA polymerase